jgi:hypothetical protein
MEKIKSRAFGKDCFLLGKDQNGDAIWLEAAKWECGWYWGFGYIETYTRQLDPANSKDISSHTHWDSILGKQNDGSYAHHINEILQESVLTESESWELSDLMKSFYTLRDAASVVRRGGSQLTANGNRDAIKSETMLTEINDVMLPSLFQEIYKILDPDAQTKDKAA